MPPNLHPHKNLFRRAEPRLFICFLLLLSACCSFAQKQNVSTRYYVYLMAGVSSPGSEFREVYKNRMGGLGINGGIGFLLNPLSLGRYRQYSPVLLGLDLHWNYLGRDKIEYNGQPYLKTEFWTGNYGLLVRLDPVSKGRFKPFADGFAGWGRYWAYTKEDKSFGQSLTDDNKYLVDKYHDDRFTTGLGAGFIIKPKNIHEAAFMLRVMYYLNGEYVAVQRSSIVITNNYLSYSVKKANANMFVIQFGVCFGEL